MVSYSQSFIYDTVSAFIYMEIGQSTLNDIYVQAKHTNREETVLKKQEITIQDPLLIAPAIEKKENETITVQHELEDEAGMVCDLESKIEIEEDSIFKTESADLSEFIQETNNDSVDVMTGHVDDDDESRRKEEEDEFSNRVTMEEFLPHLSGCQDYSSEKDFQYLSMFK